MKKLRTWSLGKNYKKERWKGKVERKSGKESSYKRKSVYVKWNGALPREQILLERCTPIYSWSNALVLETAGIITTNVLSMACTLILYQLYVRWEKCDHRYCRRLGLSKILSYNTTWSPLIFDSFDLWTKDLMLWPAK